MPERVLETTKAAAMVALAVTLSAPGTTRTCNLWVRSTDYNS
jgi:hypothetical protein